MDEATLNMLSGSIGANGFDTNMMLSSGMNGALGTLGTAINILSIFMYFGSAIGLYLINKKLGEKYAWLSFVPIIQIYNYFTASQKPFKEYLIYPIIALIIGMIGAIFTFGISLILAYIYIIIMMVKLLHAISLRTGNGVWTTVGFIFIGFIMLPIVGLKMKDKTETENIIINSGGVETTNSNTNNINSDGKIINDNIEL